MILVTGFGAFAGVQDNPSAALARALDGRRVSGETLVGRVLPVSYGPGLDEALAWARALSPRRVLGLGVAVQRTQVEVETLAVNATHLDRPDVDGCAPGVIEADGPERIAASWPAAGWAEALDAGVSEDAGRYVCNAWLYRMVRGLPGVPVSFVHVPPQGLAPERVVNALATVLAHASQ